MKQLVCMMALALLALAAGCATDESSFDAAVPAPRPTRTLQFDARATPDETLLPPSTPDNVPAIVQEFRRALQSNRAAGLEPLMHVTVWVALDGNAGEGQPMPPADGIAWLQARWGQVTVSDSEYIRDGALLSITTTGWARRAPIEKGTVLFNLHRYDADGTMDDVQGQWKIDTILYQ